MVVTGKPVDTAKLLTSTGHAPEHAVRQMLEMGAMMLEHGSSSATVDSVALEVERLIAAVADVAAQALPATLTSHVSDLQAILSEHFDPTKVGSVQSQLVRVIGDAAKAQQQELTRALVNDAGPFGVLKAELAAKLAGVVGRQELVLTQLTALRETIASTRAREDERALGTAKGADFEALVAAIIDHAFSPYGDTVENAGTALGATSSKVGDFVVHLNEDDVHRRDARIVIEAKCRKLSLKAALAELDGAKLNREADAAILVFSSTENAPTHGSLFRAYSGNRIIVVIDADEPDPLALRVACAFARGCVLHQIDATSETTDVAQLREHVDRLTKILDEARGIIRGTNAAKKGIEQVESAYETLRTGAFSVLGDIVRLLAG